MDKTILSLIEEIDDNLEALEDRLIGTSTRVVNNPRNWDEEHKNDTGYEQLLCDISARLNVLLLYTSDD